MEYFNSFEFWVYVMWVSSAVGFGLVLGGFLYLGVMAILDKFIERLMNLKFKKDEGEEK